MRPKTSSRGLAGGKGSLHTGVTLSFNQCTFALSLAIILSARGGKHGSFHSLRHFLSPHADGDPGLPGPTPTSVSASSCCLALRIPCQISKDRASQAIGSGFSLWGSGTILLFRPVSCSLPGSWFFSAGKKMNVY